MFGKKIGIDLGTTTVLVYIPNKGIIIHEPSVVAISLADKRVLSVGAAAKDMVGTRARQYRSQATFEGWSDRGLSHD